MPIGGPLLLKGEPLVPCVATEPWRTQHVLGSGGQKLEGVKKKKPKKKNRVKADLPDQPKAEGTLATAGATLLSRSVCQPHVAQPTSPVLPLGDEAKPVGISGTGKAYEEEFSLEIAKMKASCVGLCVAAYC